MSGNDPRRPVAVTVYRTSRETGKTRGKVSTLTWRPDKRAVAVDSVGQRNYFLCTSVAHAITGFPGGSRSITSAFLRAKPGEALAHLKLSPHIFETEAEALAHVARVSVMNVNALKHARCAITLAGVANVGMAQQPPSASDAPKLILLGTKGGPSVRSDNPFPSSNVLLLNGIPYVVDTGYGTTLRLNQAKVPLQTIRYVFITHHHSDHNLEYGNLLYNAWIVGLKEQVRTYGPPGLKALNDATWITNRLDIETRIVDEGR